MNELVLRYVLLVNYERRVYYNPCVRRPGHAENPEDAAIVSDLACGEFGYSYSGQHMVGIPVRRLFARVRLVRLRYRLCQYGGFGIIRTVYYEEKTNEYRGNRLM